MEKTLYKSFEVKAGEGSDGGSVTGYAATFDREPDSYGDVIAPGAFAKSLEKWAGRGVPIPLLYGHNTDDPDFNIGRVVEIAEDERGLLFTAEFDPDSAKAQYVRKLYKEGRLSQFSFAYKVNDAAPVELDDKRTAHELREIDIYEISAVQIPANQNAEVVEVKDADTQTTTVDIHAPNVDTLAIASAVKNATTTAGTLNAGAGSFTSSSSATFTPSGLTIASPAHFIVTTADVKPEEAKAGRRNSKADEDELGKILEHVAAIQTIVDGLLGEQAETPEEPEEPETEDEPEAKAEEPDTVNAEEPGVKSEELATLLETADRLLQKGDSE